MSAKSPARPASQVAPPSSPRYPSPPPLPELQLGPRSPSINTSTGELSLEIVAVQDEGAARRVRPGTSAADMARGPPFVPLHQLESPFQLQEYLKSSYCNVTRDEASDTVKPIITETAKQLAAPPIQQDTGEPVDRNLWLYELCRFLVQRTNRLIVSFFADNPPCSNQTCPEMRASEWQYLCAVHEPPKSCCAIDYCCHTLDWAANILTSTKHFPSRLSLGGEGGSAYQSMRQLTNIFRRVYRIYAHAWFQHRAAFWMLEQEEGLYKFFKTVCDVYNLIPEDNYTVPPEAEGDREDMVETPINHHGPEMHILRNDTPIDLSQHHQLAALPLPPSTNQTIEPDPTLPNSVSTSAPTRRSHRHTYSTGTQVTVIAEGEEEDDGVGNVTQISQHVAPDPTATSTIQTSASPPKPQSRSPRPEMSIPIGNVTTENIRVPEDPTPKPENHGLDPFDETSSRAAVEQTPIVTSSEFQPDSFTTQPASSPEPPTPLTALSETSNQPLPITSKTPIPQLQTVTPPRRAGDDEEVLSPGGGSIRTVGTDILSGLMRHQDETDDEVAPGKKDLSTGFQNVSSPSAEVKKEAESHITSKSLSKENQETEDQPAPKQKDVEGEDDEEMGEIKFGATEEEKGEQNEEQKEEPKKTELKTAAENSVVSDTDSKKHDGKEDQEKENEDSTKEENVAAGVV